MRRKSCPAQNNNNKKKSVISVRGLVKKMADSSSDADMLRRLLQIQTIADAMQMKRKKKRAQIRFTMRGITNFAIRVILLMRCSGRH